MKKTIYTIVMVICTGISVAQAEDIRPYAGVGLGAYGMKVTGTGAGTQTAFGGFGLIGLDYGDYLGAELRLGGSDKASFTAAGVNQEINVNYMFSYLVKLQMPVNDQFRIYALLGGTSGEAKAKITTPGFVYTATNTATIKNSETSFSAGGGIEYRVDQWSIGAEYMQYFADVYSIAGVVKFSF